MNFELAIVKGKMNGCRKVLSEGMRVIIGRESTCDFVLPDPMLSRQHCVVDVKNNKARIQDLKSRNGTFVNGKKIDKQILENNDKIRLGRHIVNVSSIVSKKIDNQIVEPTPAKKKIVYQTQNTVPYKKDVYKKQFKEEVTIPLNIEEEAMLPAGAPREIGHYKILEVLGQGGMGDVYKAKHKFLDNIVAIKVIKTELAAQTEILERFLLEAKLGMKLYHPNILRIYDASEANGNFFISMEFFKGQEITKLVKNKGKINYKKVLNWGIQIADALEYAHQKGIIHRDVKPSNVLINENSEAKLADFGLAKAWQQAGGLTAPDSTLGTIQYISPEQLTNAKDADPQADIFSFGATIYYTLAGKPPFGTKPLAKVVNNILYEDPPPLEADIPKELNKVIMKTLQKDKKNRFGSMEEVKNLLQQIYKKT